MSFKQTLLSRNQLVYFGSQSSASQQKNKYNLVIVGGGCSSFGFLLNAYRNNRLCQIIDKDGICVLEKSNRFGGGTLEENLIPSNTHTIGALRYLMREKEADMLPTYFEQYLKEGLDQSGPRPNFSEQKVLDSILPMFDELKSTETFKYILERGELTSSLQLFGYFLRLSGSTFLRNMKENNVPLDFRPNSECLKIQDKSDNAENMYKISYKDNQNNQLKEVYANKILMATGGKQNFHPMYQFVPQDKKIQSHYFLKQQGFLKALELIEQNPDKDISIIGGSHSGFSVIYMLLFGPDIYLKNELNNMNEFTKNLSKYGENTSMFGDLTPLEIHEKIKNYRCKLRKGQIKLYHRDPFRLSYMSKELALQEGYTDFDENCIHKYEGCVNSYTGLRALTKKLYEDIRSGKEDRAEFVYFQDMTDDMRADINNSSVVIECLGYNSILIDYESQQKPDFKYNIDTDNFAEMDQGHKISGFNDIYGTGLGYGIHTHDDLIGGEKLFRKVRADSIQVYLSRLSTKILNDMAPAQEQENNKIHQNQQAHL